MRRSRTVTLTLLAASAVVLQACGDDVDATDAVVADVQACVTRYGASAQAECEQAFRQAERQHAASAPRFASAEECRAATGEACETAAAAVAQPLGDKVQMGEGSGRSSLFMPALAGVMIGRMMADGRGRVTSPVYAGLPPGQCSPGAPPSVACAPRSSSSSGRFYYTGSTYAGSTGAAVGRGGSAAFTASPDMARTISTGNGAWSGARGPAAIARGGFGASARGFSASS